MIREVVRLGDDRSISGAFALAGGSVLFPWRRLGKKGGEGLSAISVDRFSKKWDLEAPEGHRVVRLLDGGGRCFAVLRGPDGVVVRSVDVEKGAWAG